MGDRLRICRLIACGLTAVVIGQGTNSVALACGGGGIGLSNIQRSTVAGLESIVVHVKESSAHDPDRSKLLGMIARERARRKVKCAQDPNNPVCF